MSIGLTTANLNFESIKEIGQQGRNSQVYLSHDKQLDAEIVIKKVLKAKIADPIEFYTEAKRLYASEHQHVVQIKYACEDTDSIYLAMPYYKNGSLKTLIDSRFLTVREIIRYSTQFLSGLHNIHVKKLIHFDIKPDNILLSDNNEALVTDFGLTKNMNSLGFASSSMHYPKQIPPEVFSQTQHSMLYDIYSAGVTLYRLCNGNHVYYNQFGNFTSQPDYIAAIQSGNFPDRTLYFSHIPKLLRRAINTAMSVDQVARYQTVLDLMNELSSINSLLDWQMTVTSNGNNWTLDLDDKIIVVSLIFNGTVYNLSATKTIKASGNTTNIASADIKNIKLTAIDKTVQMVLLSLE